MTERLYYHAPYLFEFEASVVESRIEADRYVTILDKTAFYPTSGGQQNDLGAINDVTVLDVRVSEGDVIEHITADCPAAKGESVQGLIDEPRRRRHCQQHTAQHIFSQAFYRLFGRTTLSVHLGQDYGAIEFDIPEFSGQQCLEAEKFANAAITANLPVTIGFFGPEEVPSLGLRKIPPRSGDLRVVSIGDIERSGCGGTHVLFTSEIGFVKIIGQEKLRGHALVRFLAGQQLWADYQMRWQVTDEISRGLTCHVADLPERTLKLDRLNKDQRKEIARLQREIVPFKIEQIAQDLTTEPDQRVVWAEIDLSDIKLLGQAAGQLAERLNKVTLLSCRQSLVIATPEDSTHESGQLAATLRKQFNLKGGGNARIAQLTGIGSPDMLSDITQTVQGIVADD